MAYKKKPKNKQELHSRSGVKKKPPEKKTVIRFVFEDLNQVKYKNGTGRIKVDKEGCLSFLILMPDNTWKGVKGKLISLKVTEVNRTIKKRI